MKNRIIKKKIRQVVGVCPHCGKPVYNFVSRSDYKGSCIECDEDFYSFEIGHYRRHGTPLLVSSRRICRVLWRNIYSKI